MSKKMLAMACILVSVILLVIPFTGCKYLTGEGITLEQERFLDMTPESQGMSPETLTELADIVHTYVDEERVEGAELMVLKNRNIVIHRVFGWNDRENEVPMQQDQLYNIRSMTKPITGAAAQILIDRGELRLDDRVADYLPGFDNEKSANITVEQLLTHTAGLPLSIMTGADDYTDLQTMANAVGEIGPQFPPGSKLWYSDAGADAVGGLVEVVSGQPLDGFIRENILEPLGMTDSFYYVPANQDDPRRERIANLYIGGIGEWSKIWTPQETLYPFAWGSQGLYGTALDYARFLSLWLDNGIVGDKRILSPEAISRTLEPAARLTALGSDMLFPTGFYDLDVFYGQMAMVYKDRETDRVEVIGHNGSDGTYAWAWPERDLMILYFTQSRGNTTGLMLEAEIDRLFIHPELEDINAIVREQYAPYLGTYTANFGPFHNAGFKVVVLNGKLAVDVPNQFVFELREPDSEGRWQFQLIGQVSVSFEKDASGAVTSMKLHQGGEVFDIPKGEAPEETRLDPAALQKYLGRYQTEEPGVVVTVLIHNGNLALDIPGQLVKLELYPPDEQGKWYVRLNPQLAVSFNEGADGKIESFTAHLPDGTTLLRPRVGD
jgi:CubicO group peptidase (beta-lactamase class C family)